MKQILMNIKTNSARDSETAKCVVLSAYTRCIEINAVGFVPKSDICGKQQESSGELHLCFDLVPCGVTKQIFHPVLFLWPKEC
jgi:hypothetical protein